MASTLLANNGGARKLERLHSQHLQNGSALDAAVTSTLSRSDDAFCEPIALASWSPEAATESPPSAAASPETFSSTKASIAPDVSS